MSFMVQHLGYRNDVGWVCGECPQREWAAADLLSHADMRALAFAHVKATGHGVSVVHQSYEYLTGLATELPAPKELIQ